MKKAFTVVFYFDGDYCVETFVEEVHAENSTDAWDKAVKKAHRAGGSTSGRGYSLAAFRNATEICTLHGHGLQV